MQATMIRLGNALAGYEKNMGVLANNIANADTAGYKADSMYAMSFGDVLEERITNGKGATKLNEIRSAIGFGQGTIEESDTAGSVALNGSGFICVEVNGEEAYIRGGVLEVDRQGYLSYDGGRRIIGEQGYIHVGGKEYIIDDSGNVYVDENTAGRLKIVDKRNYESLEKTGSGIFIDNAAGNDIQADCVVMQGYKENSNVDITQAYLNVMTVSRNFETTQKIVQMYDEINALTAGEIGKLY